MHVSEEKRRLRSQIKERIDAMTDEDRHAEGRTLSRLLLQELPPGPLRICAYYPLKSEVDIRLLLTELVTRGDTLYLPVFKDEELHFRRIENISDLPAGELNIPEPPESAEELGESDVDIVLVPGRAFTKDGKRLGRGSGGYDQWIEKYRRSHPNTKFWGTCLLCQIVTDIPMEEHDMMVDAVVTAMEMYRGIMN